MNGVEGYGTQFHRVDLALFIKDTFVRRNIDNPADQMAAFGIIRYEFAFDVHRQFIDHRSIHELRPYGMEAGFRELIRLLMSRYDTHIIACDDMRGIGHTNGKGFRGKNIGYGFMACTQTQGDLTAITVNDDYTGNDDAFDAFFYCLTDYKVESSFSESVTLKRPSGQLNVKTNDLAAIPDPALRPTDVRVTFSALPTSFNAMTGVVGTETAEVSYTAPVINAESGELSMDYIWPRTDEANLADFSVTFLNNNTPITTNDNFKNIPIRRNYKTNVSGNLLTKQGTIDVTIDPIWDGETPVVVDGAFNVTKNQEFASLQAAIDDADTGDVIRIWGTLDEDITIDKDLTIEGGSDDASAARIRSLNVAAGSDVTCENIEFFGIRDFWGESYGAYIDDVKSATFKNYRFTQNPDEALALATAINATGELTFDGCFFGAQPMFQQLTEDGSLTILNSDFEAWGAQIEPANYINHTIEGNTF